MAKVNLLTIHYGKCYGAVMQTYATCKLLEKAGHSVKVINLVSPAPKSFRKCLSNIVDCVREFQFWLFKKKYFAPLTNKASNIMNIRLPEADYTVVGSDQVWNRDITGIFGNTFFLDFVDKKQKKIALSSSFGKAIWNESENYTKKVKSLLSDFDAISVRESTGVKIIEDTFGLTATNIQDPTLGYGQFNDLVLNDKHLHQIFPFLLRDDRQSNEKALYIARTLGIPLFKHSKFSKRFLKGPRHWLTNIKNSDYIITDSFHGLALSVIFNKQFFVFCAIESKFTRLRSLLQLLSLENRYVDSIEDFEARKEDLLKPIDYVHVNSILKKEQEKYNIFIKSTIG